MVSPLCGFRPSRAGRAATLKVPRPETRTASPAASESRMAATTAFTAWPASLVFSSVASATFSTNSDWFISVFQLHCYETPTLKAKRCKVCARLRSVRTPREAQKSVVSPVPLHPQLGSNWTTIRECQYSRANARESCQETLESEKIAVRSNSKVETARLRGEDRCAHGRCCDTKSAVTLHATGI